MTFKVLPGLRANRNGNVPEQRIGRSLTHTLMQSINIVQFGFTVPQGLTLPQKLRSRRSLPKGEIVLHNILVQGSKVIAVHQLDELDHN